MRSLELGRGVPRTAIFLVILCAGCETLLGLQETSVSSDAGAPTSSAGSQDGWAHWPMPNPRATGLPNPQSYDLTTPDVVLDKVTGLAWQRRLDVSFHGWVEAQTYCASLVLAGHHDWRLPSRVELVSIIDFTQGPNVAAIDPVAFPNTPLDAFWSSSAFAVPSDLWDYWYVNFVPDGDVFPALADKPYRVRCVRVPSDIVVDTGGAAHYVVRDQTVLDTKTGLTWEQVVRSGELGHSDAVGYCASRALNGGGWRLPSMKELATVIDETRINAAVNPTAFPSTPARYFWTSSSSSVSSDQYFVYFGSGWTGMTPPSPMAVRCVR